MTTAVMVHPGTANETLTRWVRRSGLSRNRQGLLGVGITLLFVLVAVFADVFAPYSWEDMRPEISLQPPSAIDIARTKIHDSRLMVRKLLSQYLRQSL